MTVAFQERWLRVARDIMGKFDLLSLSSLGCPTLTWVILGNSEWCIVLSSLQRGQLHEAAAAHHDRAHGCAREHMRRR